MTLCQKLGSEIWILLAFHIRGHAPVKLEAEKRFWIRVVVFDIVATGMFLILSFCHQQCINFSKSVLFKIKEQMSTTITCYIRKETEYQDWKAQGYMFLTEVPGLKPGLNSWCSYSLIGVKGYIFLTGVPELNQHIFFLSKFWTLKYNFGNAHKKVL